MTHFPIRTVAVLTVAAFALSGCTNSGTPAASNSPAPPTGVGLAAVPEVVKDVEPSVVTVSTPIGLGSGVVYHSDGSLVTDAHVVEDKQKQPYKTVHVQFADGSQALAMVAGVDDVSDVAVLKVSRTNLPAPKYASTTPEVGSMTVVIGSPLGLTDTVTAGIVSGLHRNMPPSKESPHGAIDLLQTDAPISPGNSGGAVADGNGQIIGLSEAYLPPSSGAVSIGFVTPASTVTEVADQLLTNGSVKHAALGVVPADITAQIAQRFSLSATTGALVVNVTAGGPAAKAGMKVGDIITKFAGTAVGNVTDLLAALRKQDPGKQVDVVVQRGKTSQTLHATLGDLSKG
ncbi:MAG: trypsin-like peptidase domain-containing protein [Actinomycetota bacterium]|nr:trypsin-like peptidase domain-containing protein [Actinomycetota bacterium]